jgi:hypothetical protein
MADLRVTFAGYGRTLTGDGLRYPTTVTNNGPAATAYVLSYDIGLMAGSGSCGLYGGDPRGTKPVLAPGASADAVFDVLCDVTEGSRVVFLGHAVTA